jgi:hypothetical protein
LAIQSVQQEGSFSLQLLCEIAGIPRPSYYKWLNHKPGIREQENEHLTEAMLLLHEQVGGILRVPAINPSFAPTNQAEN